jgi:CAF1 family ribonuclease
VLPQVKAAIEDSAFVSFDTEFTGLNIKDAPSVGPYDTALEAYEKLRQSANFSVIQFGLCTFHEDPENGRLLPFNINLDSRLKDFVFYAHCRITHQAFNFYTIPTHDNFLCQTDSIKFLVSHGMDLNKVFRDGKLKSNERSYNISSFNFLLGIASLKKEEQEAKVAGLAEKLKGVKEKACKPTQTQNLQASEGQKEVIAAMK